MFHFSFGYVKVQVIEQVYSDDPLKIEDMFWYRERYWQSQIFTVTHGMINDLYSKKRKGYRKSLFQLLHCYYSTFSHSLLIVNQRITFFDN